MAVRTMRLTIMSAVILLVMLLSGCAESMGLVRLDTADGNHIKGIIQSRDDNGCVAVKGLDGSRYSIKFRSIKSITRIGDAPILGPDGTVIQDPNAPAEAVPSSAPDPIPSSSPTQGQVPST